MKILMFTNTYCPIVGGVSESVQRLKASLQEAGHLVRVVAPKLDGQPTSESDVIRVAAVQHFNGSDFSFPVPIPGQLSEAIEDFEPDLVHSHHPFLLGDTAVRTAETYGLPLVFTHHTLYEHYTHYVPGDSSRMQRFAITLSTEYTKLCDAVIAPSESIRDLLLRRGANARIGVVPSGVNTRHFASGSGTALREGLGINAQAYVVGHVGRLAREKNLPFLAEAVSGYLQHDRSAHYLVVGDGNAREAMQAIAERFGVAERMHFTGRLQGQALADAYHAMDVFVFASHSETQGMVLVEAMAAGLPVVAVAAPGVSEVVRDGSNGRLLGSDDSAAMQQGLAELADSERRTTMRRAALNTASRFEEKRCAGRCLEVYRQAMAAVGPSRHIDDSAWERARARLEAEWHLLRHRGRVLRSILQETPGRAEGKAQFPADESNLPK